MSTTHEFGLVDRKGKEARYAKDLGPEDWKPDYTKILLMTNQGLPIAEICDKVGLTHSTVSRVRNSSYFINKLASLNSKVIEKTVEKRSTSLATDKARELLTKAALLAAKKVIKLSKTGTSDQKLQFDACRDILDRAGLKPIEVLETRERVYSPEEILHAKQILLETETVVKRLSTQQSPFVLGDTRQGQLLSSDTDKALDGQHAEPTDTAGEDRSPDVPAVTLLPV